MNNKVGEKIKLLRKELNMTQSELAGTEMTKSMLSQIENNISNPSIKTLQYIADQLNRPISYFLEDNDKFLIHVSEKSKQEQAEKIKYISELIDLAKMEEAKKELEALIASSTNKTSIKTHADLLFKLGSALLKLNNPRDGEKYIALSIQAYVAENFYIEGAKAYIELAKVFYQQFNYEECLNICKKAFELYYKNMIPDPIFEIELYHYKILILSALGDIKNVDKTIENAIKLSTKTAIYYKTDELYRLNAVFSFLKGNNAEYIRSIEKAIQFAEFTEDKACLAKIYIIIAMEAVEANNAEKALEYAEKNKYYNGKSNYIYYLIKGRAYYILGNYEAAYENIIKVDFPSYERHKFDYLNMWSSKVYEGLILNKLGKHTAAIEAMKIAIEKMSIFDKSKFLVRAYTSLSEVYSAMGDFESAFTDLKKANELQAVIDKDDNIIF